MKRIDPLTKEEFTPTRRNQIFKSPTNRVQWNNEKAAQIRDKKAAIDRVLLKNYLILSEQVKEGEDKSFTKEELKNLGFNINVFTHYERIDESIKHCLYHYAIFPAATADTLTIKNLKRYDRPLYNQS